MAVSKRKAKKSAAKTVRKTPAKTVVKKAAAKKKGAPKPAKKAARKPKATAAVEFSQFPPESVTASHRTICLACVMDIFIRHFGLSPRTASSEIRQYTPSIEELTAPPTRPYFEMAERCPFCGSPSKWHASLAIHRIESGKATDTLRRKLIADIAESEKYLVLEEKATQQHAFFDWLEKTSEKLDLTGEAWLLDAAMHYLGRKEPKTHWETIFPDVGGIRRSRRLAEGWEIETGRLYLTPMLFDEVLLVQYLLSRSHLAGGLTFEGRYTLAELLARLRASGYLRHEGITSRNSADVLDQLIASLGGGEASARFYYIVDRREFLERVKSIQSLPLWRVRRTPKG